MSQISKDEFDKFADEYTKVHSQNISFSGESPDFFSEYKIQDLLTLLSLNNLDRHTSILDFGCGVGNSIKYLNKYFPTANIYGVDVSQKSIHIANQRFGELANLITYDGESLPYKDNSFDVVFSACVFHHIPSDLYPLIFAEIRRVLKKNGLFVVFEHNPLNPLTLRAVNTCPFDENAVLLKCSDFRKVLIENGFSSLSHKYRIFFPNILKILRPLEKSISWLPLGAQYFISATND